MSDEVLHLTLGRDTSADIWAAISSALGSTSEARCINLLGQFQQLRQGNATIADYIARAGVLVESLIQAGRPLSQMEQTLYIIRGLRPELKALATSLTASGASVTLSSLSDFLQAHEFILVDDFPSADATASHTALYVGTNRGGGSHGSDGRHSSNQQRGGGGRGNRGGQRGGRGGQGGPRCQISHATPDAAMMGQSDEYGGSDVLRVGNGAGFHNSGGSA
ncbi:PREDICTED: eukaryotic translation initiation factor 3 subunit F-like [Ipomoea nil]|uniref:eukaryotic translation initiation factor 3 subunit F-like n=1 Tax=Ipomoea nil TaxID=35883 RepID=UPI000900C922|nr:PREDICTED: eukaryotic translation initiation factor 3 subunit F-like [Ipomoea nil]